MKKLILICAVGVFTLSFTSCKKDYKCVCSATAAGITLTSETTIKDTKKKAETACEALNSTVAGTTTSCKIK